MTSESYVIQGLVAAGTFLSGLFVIFRYVINKTTNITENSHKTIQTLSESHTRSMSELVKDSVKAQEKVANAVDGLNKTLLSQTDDLPRRSDLELFKQHFDNRHDIIESKIDKLNKIGEQYADDRKHSK